MVIEQFKENLKDCLKCRWSVIFIESFDFSAVSDELWNAIENEKLEKVFPINGIREWNPGYGETIFRGSYINTTGGALEDTIRTFIAEKTGMLVLKNIHDALQNEVIRSLLQTFVFINEKKHIEKRSIIVIMDALYQLPIELEKLFYRLTFPYPDRDDIEKELLKEQYPKHKLLIENPIMLESCVNALVGMQMYEVRTLLRNMIDKKGRIDTKSIQEFSEYKKQIVKNSNVLEVIEPDLLLDDIGGLENLKNYLNRKKIILKKIDKRKEHNLPAPKGILLVGPPGCGKTITAKAIATIFEIPLLRLDMGRLMGSYVGESEHNLAKAIAAAEAAHPCVLWIDEIEKAFSGSSNDTGTNSEIVRRMVGSFLTWLQERKSEVYVAATANDANSLPPELKRKGRLDDIFYINYPNKEERKSIFEISLKKYGFEESFFSVKNIELMSVKSDFYSGAEINASVQTACENFILNSSEEYSHESIIKEIMKILLPLDKNVKDKRKVYPDVMKSENFRSASEI